MFISSSRIKVFSLKFNEKEYRYQKKVTMMKTRLAQLEERSAFNRVVVGSIPTSGGFLLDRIVYDLKELFKT